MAPSLVALVDADGVVVSRDGSNLMRGENLSKAYPVLGDALKSGRAGSAVWINRQRQEQLLVSYAIVRGDAGAVAGAVVVGTPLNDERMTRTSELSSGSVLVFARSSDKGLDAVADSAGTNTAAVSAATTAPVANAARNAVGNRGIAAADAAIDGNLFGVMPVDGYGPTDTVLITAVPASRIESVASLLWPVLAVGVLGLALVVFAGVMLGNYISQPVSELEDGLLAIINGQQDLRFQIEHDELGGLVFRINSLLNAMTGVPEDTTDDQGRPSKAPSANDFQEPA
jgi:methyl-accepting chemotaxis protein